MPGQVASAADSHRDDSPRRRVSYRVDRTGLWLSADDIAGDILTRLAETEPSLHEARSTFEWSADGQHVTIEADTPVELTATLTETDVPLPLHQFALSLSGSETSVEMRTVPEGAEFSVTSSVLGLAELEDLTGSVAAISDETLDRFHRARRCVTDPRPRTAFHWFLGLLWLGGSIGLLALSPHPLIVMAIIGVPAALALYFDGYLDVRVYNQAAKIAQEKQSVLIADWRGAPEGPERRAAAKTFASVFVGVVSAISATLAIVREFGLLG